MSDHPQEAQRRMKHIFICNDVLLDIFLFIEPAKVGLKLALLSIRFDALVDLHFKERKWALDDMQIQASYDTNRNRNGVELVQYKDHQLEVLPFPQQPPPDNIIGFTRLEISCIDPKVFAFLRLIEPIFDAGITILLHTVSASNLNRMLQEIWPLLAPHISELRIAHMGGTSDCYYQRRILIAPTGLRECVNLRLISSAYSHHFPEPTTADDGPEASCAEAVFKWLHTPRGDGRPKVFCSGIEYVQFCWRVEKIKEAFLEAKTAVNYVIFLSFVSSCGAVPFSMDNRRTRERLALELVNGYTWMMKRGAIGADDKRAQCKRKENTRSNNGIEMNFITILGPD